MDLRFERRLAIVVVCAVVKVFCLAFLLLLCRVGTGVGSTTLAPTGFIIGSAGAGTLVGIFCPVVLN